MTSGYTEEGIFPFLVEEHRKAGLHPVVALKEGKFYRENMCDLIPY
jgi:hypothetical protein